MLLSCAVLCIGASLLADGAAMRRAAVRQIGHHGLMEVGFVAGLRRPDGSVAGGRPLPVEVVQEGGPTWLRDEIVKVVDADPAFEERPSGNMLRIEVASGEDLVAFRLHLWRVGWSVRTPGVLRMRVSPWVPAASGLLGALLAFFSHRVAVGLLLAGLLAQITAGLQPWPAPLGPQSYSQAWAEGPLWLSLTEAVRSMSDLGVSLTIGGIVLCAMLIAFDHRRSRKQGEAVAFVPLLVATVIGFVALVAWAEAGLRFGLWAWMTTWMGWLGLAALGGAWLPAALRARERLRV